MKLLITRCLPETVVAAARARFDVTYRDDPMPLPAPDLRAALRDYDAVLPTLGDLFRADVFADVPAPAPGFWPTSAWAITISTSPPPVPPGCKSPTPPVPSLMPRLTSP